VEHDARAIERWLCERVARQLELEPGDIDVDATFESFGLSSADAISLSGELELVVARELDATLIYEHPTIRLVARALCTAPRATPAIGSTRASAMSEPVAIIGIACRFPGRTEGHEAFWDLLAAGRDAIGTVPSDRWDAAAYLDPDPAAPGKAYTQAGGFVDDVGGFDAELFKISPAEALRMDPQQRMLLEGAWAALEDAGLAADRLAGTQTGVFVGLMEGLQYTQLQLLAAGADLANDPFFAMGAAQSVAAGRISYLLDLRGPALSVDTACSSSLVCTHLAVQSLRRGECDYAIAGGASLIAHPQAMVQACKMGMLAPDGQVKTFDAAADGFVMAEGCGVVVLQRACDARAEGRHVHAIIEGTAINQDGRSNGLTAPSRSAQAAVIGAALADASVQADDVDYVETHGSGTKLGDAIEVGAIRDVFGERGAATPDLALGAVKSNVGHLQAGAGAAGLIKTALMLKHAWMPRTLHVDEVNPALRLDGTRIAPTLSDGPWPVSMRPRRAGVSSFGWSGTNAHAVLTAPPRMPTRRPTSEPWQLLVLSAATTTALAEIARQVTTLLSSRDAPPLQDVAYTLATGRARLACRVALVCRDTADAIRQLEAVATSGVDDPGVPSRASATDPATPGRRQHLQEAGVSWASGDDIAWSEVFSNADVRLARLPTYPFRRARYWPEAAPADEASAFADAKRPDLADWCWAHGWKRSLGDRSRELPAGPWLIFADTAATSLLVAALRERGDVVTVVSRGDGLVIRPGDDCVADPAAADHVAELVAALKADGCLPRQVVHAWMATPTATDATPAETLAELDRGYWSVSAVLRELLLVASTDRLEVIVAASRAMDVLGDEATVAARAMVASLCTSAAAEASGLRCRFVDAQTAEQVLTETTTDGDGDVVAWRGAARWIRELQPVRLGRPDDHVWRHRGVYLITGGTGGLGMALARHLARTFQARLVLVARSAAKRAAEVSAEIAALGGEALVLSADASDRDSVARCVNEGKRRFGTINGVVHAAGVPGSGLLIAKSREAATAVLRPKVLGTLMLAEALRSEPLDFMVAFSSSAASLGGPGESDYAPANAFMDAWAESAALPAVSVAWGAWQSDTWQEQIFADAPALLERIRDYRRRLGISDVEGFEILSRVLHSGLRHVVVLPQDPATTKRAIADVAATAGALTPVRRRQLFPRPELRVAYRPPRHEREQQLATIWSEQLGLERVGIDDPFFELGGTSLVAISILARIEADLGLTVPAASLFEAGTVGELAALVDGTATPDDGRLLAQSERGERRRQLAQAARRGRLSA
jgi:acyl transferase domain-containing protein/acyl carrier protein